MVEQRKKFGSIVALFDKTPPMVKMDDVFCPHFWEVKPFNGCKFDCQWCYLNGTFRFQPHGKAPYRKKKEDILRFLREALEENDVPSLYNIGEVADGLVFPTIVFKDVIPLFREFYAEKGHKLLILTKDPYHREKFYAAKAHQFVVVSYSLNNVIIAHKYETGAPHPYERIAAAKYIAGLGYEIRFRIDPMVPVNNFHVGYHDLNKTIMAHCPNATVITLGSLRGLNSTITAGKMLRKDMSWIEYLGEKTNWGLRVPHADRKLMYEFTISDLRKLGYNGDIGLCKETLRMWTELEEAGLVKPHGDALCNCIMEAGGHEANILADSE